MPLSPKVSVAISCYNHEAYIEAAVLSALRQETDFSFEVLVGDDCSTDRSRERVLKLCETHGDRLRLIQTDRNMGGRENFLNLLRTCRGEYVAYLDGDDYWIGRSKLKAQVDLMDANPNLAMCTHPVYVCDQQGEIFRVSRMRPKRSKASYDFQDIVQKNFIPSCSNFFRRELFQGFPAWMPDYPNVPGDMVMILTLARRGGIGYLNEKMAAYRVHERGTWSAKDEFPRLKARSRIYSNFLRELDPVEAKATRLSQARLRVRIAAAHAKAGRPRRARLYLRYAWSAGWLSWPVWRQSFIYVLDVYFPRLSKQLRDLRSPGVKPNLANGRRDTVAQMIDH